MSLSGLIMITALASAQARLPDGGEGLQPDAYTDHLSHADLEPLLAAEKQGLATLKALGKAIDASATRPKTFDLQWPLAPRPGFGEDYIGVSNFVDSDPAFPDQIRDYSCGTRSYDTAEGYNHQGIDFFTWPFAWTLMDAGAVDIVAAADGVILVKRDGNFDRECSFDNNTPNMVFVQHDDGTVAWYLHMKNGSTTAKAIGDRVVAGEYLGKVGSSGISTGPHLHFELRDGPGQRAPVIDPFSGSCNFHDSFWAEQRPYYHSKINRLTTHSSPPSIPRCPQTTDSPNVSDRFAADSEITFAAYYTDQRRDQPTQFRILRPDGSTFRSWTFDISQNAGNSDFYAAAYWFWSYRIGAAEPGGVWRYEATYEGRTTVHSFEVGVATNHSNLYWNPEQPGWGLNLQHQGSLLYGTWYSYAVDGQVMFLTIEASADSDGSYIGPIYRVSGTPLEQINNAQAFSQVTSVGTAHLRFDQERRLSLDYFIDGVALSAQLEPFVFAEPAIRCHGTVGSRASAINYTDLWWNPLEAGWGLSLSHQGDTIFALWYTYGEGGRDQWISASNLTLQADGSYRGALQQPAMGTPLAQISGAATQFPVPAIGNASLIFIDGENAVFSYQIGDISQAKTITRFVAVADGEALPLCGF